MNKLSKQLFKDLLSQLDTCVWVTGTNGKSTTTALLHSMLTAQGNDWITNDGGANLVQGLLSALLRHTNWRGQLRVKSAVLEVDEATFPYVMRQENARLVIVTNVVRDQLDRYGEIDYALKMLREGLQQPDVQILLNGDDPLAAYLGLDRALAFYFGMSRLPMDDEVRHEVRDGAFCLLCGQELQYDQFYYGQMGIYHCPNGHFERPSMQFLGHLGTEAGVMVTENLRGNEQGSHEYEVAAPIQGLYNGYNLLAAVAAARILGVNPAQIAKGALAYKAPLGRMQVFSGSCRSTLTLIKNPTGANSVLRAIEADKSEKSVCFVINDSDADGRDVSWLWDIDLEHFVQTADIKQFYCAGKRRLDMAIRLYYAGLEKDKIQVIDTLIRVPVETENEGYSVYILSTYTALYSLAQYLEERISS